MQTVIDQDTGKEFTLFNSKELKDDLAKHWSEVCPHSRLELAQVRYKNGSLHIRMVCLDCGEYKGDTLKKSETHGDLPIVDSDKIRKVFAESRRHKYDQILQKHVRLQRRREAGFQIEYTNYLASAEWKRRREKVLKRANFICEGCLERKATVVHHLNYNSIYSEMLFDLVALCRECHAECHPDKNEPSEDEVLSDDLPCYGCRCHGERVEGSWCEKFDVHTTIALTDRELCGPKARELEPLK